MENSGHNKRPPSLTDACTSNDNDAPVMKKSASFSQRQRKHHRIYVTHLEIIYGALLMINGILLIIGFVWLRMCKPDDPTSEYAYKSLPNAFAILLYAFAILLGMVNIFRFSCFSCCDRASNVDRGILCKLVTDPFVLFLLTVGILYVSIEILDPTSNITVANSIILGCQLISVAFADSLVDVHKTFDMFCTCLLIFQAALRVAIILFLTENRVYNTGFPKMNVSRNGIRRELLVQLMNALLPTLIAFVQDLHRFRIRLLQAPLYRFEIASINSFQHATRKQQQDIFNVLSRKHENLLQLRHDFLKHYGGNTQKQARVSMVERYSAMQSFSELEQSSTHANGITPRKMSTRQSRIGIMDDNMELERRVRMDEILYSVVFLFGVILYLYVTFAVETLKFTSDINSINGTHINATVFSPSSSTVSSIVEGRKAVFPLHLVVLTWVLCFCNVFMLARRFLCCGRNINVDLDILRAVSKDPIVIMLCVVGILVIVLEITVPSYDVEFYLASKIGFLCEAATILFGDAAIITSRWFDLLHVNLFIVLLLYTYVTIWFSTAKDTHLFAFRMGGVDYVKSNLNKILYLQIITAMFLIVYRIFRDPRRTRLRLLTTPIYRFNFMNSNTLELRKPKRCETILKVMTKLGKNIEQKKMISSQALQTRVRTQTIDSVDSKTYGNPMNIELRKGKAAKILGAMND